MGGGGDGRGDYRSQGSGKLSSERTQGVELDVCVGGMDGRIIGVRGGGKMPSERTQGLELGGCGGRGIIGLKGSCTLRGFRV